MLQAEIVFLDVFGRNFSPVADYIAGKKISRLPTGCFNRGQGTGRREHTTKGEEWPHAVSFVFSTFGLATGVSGTAGTPFASAAWKVSGVMPNFAVRCAH